MKKILFETHHIYYWPNFLPVIEELKERNEYLIEASMPVRSSKNEFTALKKICNGLNIKFIESDSEIKRIKRIKSERYDVIIVGNVGQLNKLVNNNTIAVMVYHGIGLKQSYYNDTDKRINLRSVESVARYKELQELGHNNIVLTGFTKLDRLITISKAEIKVVREKLDLDTNRKTVLFAPTFYPTSLELLYNEIKVLSQECNVIIKLHAFSWEQSRYKYQSQMYKKLSIESKSIILLENNIYDIIPFYKIADLLISDISSTLFEFLPMDKPIIQSNCFKLRFKHKIFNKRFMRKLDLSRLINIDFSYKINEPSDLLSRVFYALENPKDMSDKRKIALKHYLYNFDGKASSRLIDSIEDYKN